MSDATTSLDSYYQVGNAAPTDSYVPGDGKQRVDLSEYYEVNAQTDATIMVMGSEELSLGKLSRRVAVHLKLKGAETYDPFPSERNARMGAEGFFSAVYEGFKSFIETIIKYIRMAIDWVVDLIKGIFGFRKSARITKAIDDSLGELKKEFESVMVSLGFNVAEYNVENFLGNLPAGQDRVAQIHLLKNKFDRDSNQVERLNKAVPIIQQIMGKIRQAEQKVSRSQKDLKKVILDEYNRTRVRQQGNMAHQAESSELNRLNKALLETKLSFNMEEVTPLLQTLFKELYDLEFDNVELANKFNVVQDKLKANVQAIAMTVPAVQVNATLNTIGFLNTRYQELVDGEVDISKIDWKALGSIIDKTDSEKVQAIATHANAPGIVGLYQEVAAQVRNFVNACFAICNEVLRVERQIVSLVEWYNRIHAYYYGVVMDDIKVLEKVVKDAESKGLTPRTEAVVLIKDADAKTFMEKLSANANFALKNDIGGLQTSLNNFTKQIGMGKLI